MKPKQNTVMTNLYIVLFDTEDGICSPMGWDSDCEGAICCWSGSVAVFDSRKTARKAIAISQRFQQLCAAQGKPSNTDFALPHRNLLKIVPLEAALKEAK